MNHAMTVATQHSKIDRGVGIDTRRASRAEDANVVNLGEPYTPFPIDFDEVETADLV